MIHVSATWFSNAVNMVAAHGAKIEDIQAPFVICVYNSISRFAVPCFIMLSGAFILDNKKNADYKKFYSKAFAQIGVPTIVFSILYILYRVPLCFVDKDKGINTLLVDILRGSPMFHMWYLYMLIGIYALTPVVIRFKDSVTEKTFYKVSFVFLILASISRWTTEIVRLNWSVGQSFEYLGYFMVGYSIRKILKSKNNCKAIVLIGIGVFWEMCAAALEYKEIIDGIAEADLKFKIVEPYCPLIVPASICIFVGFTLLEIKKEYINLSALIFYIYLIHAGVWGFISKVYQIIFHDGRGVTGLNGAIWIPVFVIVVFAISYLLSKLYLMFWAKLDREQRITHYLVKIVRLQAD